MVRKLGFSLGVMVQEIVDIFAGEKKAFFKKRQGREGLRAIHGRIDEQLQRRNGAALSLGQLGHYGGQVSTRAVSTDCDSLWICSQLLSMCASPFKGCLRIFQGARK